jgi:hypothetical protein
MPTEARRLSWVTDDVLVVDQNAALLKIVEAQEQADERRFSGSRPADEADFLAWRYRKGKSIDDERRVDRIPRPVVHREAVGGSDGMFRSVKDARSQSTAPFI